MPHNPGTYVAYPGRIPHISAHNGTCLAAYCGTNVHVLSHYPDSKVANNVILYFSAAF